MVLATKIIEGLFMPPPAFSPRDLMALYLEGRHDALSEQLLAILRHFEATSYTHLEPQGRTFVNAFVTHFLTLFIKPDYTPGRAHLAEFIKQNLTISNLAAMSSHSTTDAYLSALLNRPAELGKVLALYSARNTCVHDRETFFDADTDGALTNLWYGVYADIYRSGLVREGVAERLREHLAFRHPRLDFSVASLDSYFSSTYVGEGADRNIKPAINQAMQQRAALQGWRVESRPNPRKVAIFSGNWSPIHSVYRITQGYIEALRQAGYHLTFFPLNRRADVDLTLFHEVRPLTFGPNGLPDWPTLQGHDFQVACYPDVGLTPSSIMLANLRIAPIQVALLGHSVSTFGSEIDYFFSGVDVEPADHPERNYSERLVLLPGLGAIHNRPNFGADRSAMFREGEAPAEPPRRLGGSLALPEPEHAAEDRSRPSGQKKDVPEFVINAPWNAQKVNHAFARTLGELVRRSSRAIKLRVFVSASLSRRNDLVPFVRDLEAVVGRNAVEVRAGLSYPDYMAQMEEGEITLDSYPFGGCNTVIDSLYLRKLTVCWEGDAWYARIGPQMLRQVSLSELVATSADSFLEIALKLIHDDGFRAALQARLNGADLDATLFNRTDARFFPEAIAFLVENHDRLRADADRSPIWVG
jgi:hypothetical protein